MTFLRCLRARLPSSRRRLASTTVKSVSDSLTSGRSTAMPLRPRLGDELHDLVGVVLVAGEQRREELDREVRLRYAVWYVSRPYAAEWTC